MKTALRSNYVAAPSDETVPQVSLRPTILLHSGGQLLFLFSTLPLHEVALHGLFLFLGCLTLHEQTLHRFLVVVVAGVALDEESLDLFLFLGLALDSGPGRAQRLYLRRRGHHLLGVG